MAIPVTLRIGGCRALAIFACALLALAPAAQAARVSPMMVTVAPSGRGSTTRVELTNPSTVEYPVEAQVFKGTISEQGELDLTPADDDFMVFPPQAIVPAKSQQVFRVQYLGDPGLKNSELYYLQIRQVPVALAGKESGVQFLVNFNVLLNVVPPDSRPAAVVESAVPSLRDAPAAKAPEPAAPPAADKPTSAVAANKPAEAPVRIAGVEVRVHNNGTRFFNVGMVPWEIAGTATDGTAIKFKLAPEEVIKSTGVGVVAPGRTRVFFIPTPKALAAGTVQVRLST